ncbi:MAG: hypothetical protein MJA29_02155 [Candidatus Omnitrophica bacterium]|nr:hypothetical protein [Candidatus Omnitrophota bacterium]
MEPASKSRSLRTIEERMRGMNADSLRYHVLDSAKKFKTSWVDLGRALYTVWKDKAYKGWGYGSFETYTAKEIGVRRDTAMKLLKSYCFLEQEEPQVLQAPRSAPGEVSALPGYESVNVLRLAKNRKELGEDDYAHLKKRVFEEGKDAGDLRKDVSSLLRRRQELAPEEAWCVKRASLVRRLVGTLKTIRQEAASNNILPVKLIGEIEALIKKLENEME